VIAITHREFKKRVFEAGHKSRRLACRVGKYLFISKYGISVTSSAVGTRENPPE